MAKIGYKLTPQEKPIATSDKLLDALMKDYKKSEDLIGENGLLKQLTKKLLERAMQAEMTEHLRGADLGSDQDNMLIRGYLYGKKRQDFPRRITF